MKERAPPVSSKAEVIVQLERKRYLRERLDVHCVRIHDENAGSQ